MKLHQTNESVQEFKIYVPWGSNLNIHMSTLWQTQGRYHRQACAIFRHPIAKDEL